MSYYQIVHDQRELDEFINGYLDSITLIQNATQVHVKTLSISYFTHFLFLFLKLWIKCSNRRTRA